MEAVHTNPELASLLPFVRPFHGKDSVDDDGVARICQGEGSEQGDNLLQLFFSLLVRRPDSGDSLGEVAHAGGCDHASVCLVG